MMAAMEQSRQVVPMFRPGDTVRVHMKVKEGEGERIQLFEGVVIARRGRGPAETFTVRKVSFGVGVERTFPVTSPHVEKIELVRSGRARRARLYYLRGLTGRAARLGEREGGQSPSPEAKSEPKADAPKLETKRDAPSLPKPPVRPQPKPVAQ